ALCQGQHLDLPAVRPYQDYLRWLQQQDLTQALQFWRQTLAGFETPTILQGDRHRPTASSDAQVEDLLLSEACSARLHALCRTHQLTLNTLLQGTWALLLSRYCDREDIVFGVTVSGRPVELLGVQDMVGLFINTLPVRLHLQAQQPLLPWLHALQAQQSEARQYEYSPLAQVQTCSQVPAGQPLFESLLVFENYPLQSASVEQMSLSCEQVQMAERTNYPLTLLVSPGPQILLRLSAQANRYSLQWSRRLLEHLQALLERLL